MVAMEPLSVPATTSVACASRPGFRQDALSPLTSIPPIDEQGAVSHSLAEPSPGGFISNESNVEVSSNRSSRNSLRNLREVGTAIKLSLKAASGFSTLRDMGGVVVRPCDLTPVRKLGEGAFAVVEEAQYKPDGTGGAGTCLPRRVAVKRLKPEIINHEGDLQAFINEVALLRKLANRRVVEYIGMGSTDTSSEDSKRKTMFLVQEFMEGGTLKKVVSRQMVDVTRQLYSYPDAFRWATHIAEGLEYLHSASPVVIHRDLKLENILLKETNPQTAEAKIADFGLVALVRPRDRGLHSLLAASDAAHLQQSVSRYGFQQLVSFRTRAQTVQELWDQSFRLAQIAMTPRHLPPQQLSGRTGSYMYMAPEMYRKEEYSEKVDVFSYGVILFEVLSRYQMICAVSHAGTEEEIESYAQKVSRGYRPPLPESWPESVRQLVARCWHQDPAQRPTMTWVKERLLQLHAQGVPDEMQMMRAQHLCVCAIM